MQVNLIRSLAALVVGLILLGVWSLTLSAAQAAPAPTAVPSPTAKPDSPTTTVQATAVPSTDGDEATATPIVIPATLTPSPTAVTIPTATDLPEPTVTPAPKVPTATVTSGVGVWLRAAPNADSEQLEWVLEGATLILLPGLEQGPEFDWQQVRTLDGNEGWVAVPFITYSEQ